MHDPTPQEPSPIRPTVLLDSGTSDLSLRTFLDQLPTSCGVYLMYDRSERVLYVGKARNLRLRVPSYFQGPGSIGTKERALVERVARIECILTDSETEALVLEANLIKHHHPHYNVFLKDDKSYPYIRITNEEYPRIRKTRRVVKDGSHYFGPYTSVRDMNVLLRTVSRLFYARSCDDKLPFGPDGRECLDYHIGRCLAPCTGRIGPDEYRTMIRGVEKLLSGNATSLIDELADEMHDRARALDFEGAAILRDQLRGIERVASRQRTVTSRPVDLDVVAIAFEAPLACAAVLEIRGGRLLGRKAHRLHLGAGEPPEAGALLEMFLQQYYLGNHEVPPTVLVERTCPNHTTLEESLAVAKDGKVRVVVPRRGERRRLLDLARQNVGQVLREHTLSKMGSTATEALDDLALMLDLPAPPHRIEAFDISHIQGTHVVAGMVVFTDGQPDRSDYRRFRIRGDHGNDDFASMEEVITRRYLRVRREGLPPPDLVLVDGGKGQLSAALGGLAASEMSTLPIIGLAKRLEEVFVPERTAPLPIRPGSRGHLLLRRIRDEVHRHAVTYHRMLRSKKSIESQLDDVPGVGPTRRKALLERFGSVAAIESAGFDTIAQVPGIGPGIAREILLRLAARTTTGN